MWSGFTGVPFPEGKVNAVPPFSVVELAFVPSPKKLCVPEI